MDGLQRVTFRFGPEIEVRYLPRIPAPGDFVSHTIDLWIVSCVSADLVGATVVCRPNDGDDRRLRRVA